MAWPRYRALSDMASSSSIVQSCFLRSTSLFLLFLIISPSPSFAQQRLRAPKVVLNMPVSKPASTALQHTLTYAAGAQSPVKPIFRNENLETSILSIIRVCSIIVLVLFVILSVMLKLMAFLKVRDAVPAGTLPILVLHQPAAAALLSSHPQHAPLAPPHGGLRGNFLLNLRDHISLDVDDFVEINM